MPCTPCVSFNEGRTSTRVACSAGASPNITPVSRESPAVAASTCQFSSARSVKLFRPLASRRVRKRIPHMAHSTPQIPLKDASNTLSVISCRTMRNRPAPMLNRSAISRRRAAERANNRLATLAQASNSTAPAAAASVHNMGPTSPMAIARH